MPEVNLKYKFIDQLKKLSLFSNWKFFLFLLFGIILLIILFLKFDFGLLFNSFKTLGILGLGIIFLISLFEQYLFYIRFKIFYKKKYSLKEFIYYIPTNFSSQVIPPPPVGYYARFLLTKYYYKTSIKQSIFLVMIDNFLEAASFLVFAIFGLIFFPETDLGLGILLVSLFVIGILYYVFNYYETKKEIIKSSVFKKIINYLSKIKSKFLVSIYKDIKKNKLRIFLAFLLSLFKFIINILKVYVLFYLLGNPLSIIAVFGLVSIYLFISATSSLPGGIGVAELSFVLLASSLGVDENLALLIALLERFFSVWLWVLLGAIIVVYEKANIAKVHRKFLTFLANTYENIKLNKSKKKMKLFNNKNK